MKNNNIYMKKTRLIELFDGNFKIKGQELLIPLRILIYHFHLV